MPFVNSLLDYVTVWQVSNSRMSVLTKKFTVIRICKAVIIIINEQFDMPNQSREFARDVGVVLRYLDMFLCYTVFFIMYESARKNV